MYCILYFGFWQSAPPQNLCEKYANEETWRGQTTKPTDRAGPDCRRVRCACERCVREVCEGGSACDIMDELAADGMRAGPRTCEKTPRRGEGLVVALEWWAGERMSQAAVCRMRRARLHGLHVARCHVQAMNRNDTHVLSDATCDMNSMPPLIAWCCCGACVTASSNGGTQ